ncbi:hypothetical protein [Mesorhizobium sp. M0041]|uniref:hypothetical protein n=1 Tax=Mesorhizobium sp. M0041 TaxID=2956856 RepID=UPI0033391371
MKIFASWSGKQSHAIAQTLKDWLPNVLQAVDVFVSSRDIASGERGLNTIATSLADRGFGIIVLTKSNLKAPWVLFEAGALSNTLPGRVTPLLCDLPELALAGSPLSQFQFNKFDEAGILKLAKDVNRVSANPIDEQRLAVTFEKFWPDLEKAYKLIPDDEEKPKESAEAERISAALAQIISGQNTITNMQSDIKGLFLRTWRQDRIDRLYALEAAKDIETFGVSNIMGSPNAPHSAMFELPPESPSPKKPASPIRAPKRRARF